MAITAAKVGDSPEILNPRFHKIDSYYFARIEEAAWKRSSAGQILAAIGFERLQAGSVDLVDTGLPFQEPAFRFHAVLSPSNWFQGQKDSRLA